MKFYLNKSGYNLHMLVLWEVQGECKNYNVLHGHKNAILEAKWLTDAFIVSASADKTVRLQSFIWSK